MKFNEFKELVFIKANEVGFSEYELYYTSGENFQVQMFKNEIDKYNVNSSMGVCFRGIYNEKMGYAFTEVMDNEAVELLINNAKLNAEIIEKNDKEFIFEGSPKYHEVNAYNINLGNMSADKKIEMARKLERETYNYSDKVISTAACTVASGESIKKIVNSKGLDLEFKSNAIYGVIGPVVKDGEKVNSAYAYDINIDPDKLSMEKIAHEGVDEALAYFGAETVESGKYNVMFNNKAAASILKTFSSIFNAENAQKGLSLFNDKVDNIVASEIVTIIDNPILEGGLSSTTFDDEGVATYEKNIIEEGTLKTLLHNLKTANKDGIKSTGNAFKASYSSPIAVAPTNFYIKEGKKNYEEMIKTLDNGLIITSMQGMHSGASDITGDFSLGAKGFLVQDGKVIRPVEQITIAGNFYKVLNDVIEVGNDLRFNIGGISTFGSPSIIVKDISVAGK